MSLSLALADTYISRILGGASSTDIAALARDALGVAMEDLLHRNDWEFLLLDTSQPFTVASCVKNGTTTVTHASSGFAAVLVGMTISGTGIPADTTVTAVASAGSITISAAATDSGTDTLTFGGTIPIIAGTASYKLPAKFWKPYSCHLVSDQNRPLRFVHQSYVDRITDDLTTQGEVRAYTIYDAEDFSASGTQQTKIQFFRPPDSADVALLRYYRFPDVTADPVDWHNHYLYALLDYARVLLLETKNATDRRIPYLRARAEEKIARAISIDRNPGGIDQDDRIMTPGEIGYSGTYGPPFWPWGDDGAGSPW